MLKRTLIGGKTRHKYIYNQAKRAQKHAYTGQVIVSVWMWWKQSGVTDVWGLFKHLERMNLWRWDGVRWFTSSYSTVKTKDGTRVGRKCKRSFSSHAGLIPAANAAAQRGTGAMASSVTKATTAALTAQQARGGVPFAEGPPGFIAANQEIGGGAALHTQERVRAACGLLITLKSFYFEGGVWVSGFYNEWNVP